jgi:hypothetical protein
VLSISYATYGERLAQGTLGPLVSGRPCPASGCGGRLVLTEKSANRGAVLPGKGGFCFERTRVGVARCRGGSGKSHWHRVLPAELVHGKVYSVPCMEAAVSKCVKENRSLRRAVGEFGRYAPHFSTLHGWIGGLGRYARMRETPEEGMPFGTLLAKTRRAGLPDAEPAFRMPVRISGERWRVKARGECLEAVAKLLRAARAVFPFERYPLSAWVSRAAGFRRAAPVRWWSAPGRTCIRHHPGPPDRLSSPPKARPP